MTTNIETKTKVSNRPTFKSLPVAAALALFIIGATLIGFALLHQRHAPSPSASAAAGLNSRGHVSDHKNDIPPKLQAYSPPALLTIPAIQLTSRVNQVGKNPDGTTEVPKAPIFNEAAWFKYSPTPGQYGATVILGHVDSHVDGESVFFNLGKLQPEDMVTVKRGDGVDVRYKVYAVKAYDKANFPTEMVYAGPPDTSELRLVTCSGTFDQRTAEYNSNTVVFAKIVI